MKLEINIKSSQYLDRGTKVKAQKCMKFQRGRSIYWGCWSQPEDPCIHLSLAGEQIGLQASIQTGSIGGPNLGIRVWAWVPGKWAELQVSKPAFQKTALKNPCTLRLRGYELCRKGGMGMCERGDHQGRMLQVRNNFWEICTNQDTVFAGKQGSWNCAVWSRENWDAFRVRKNTSTHVEDLSSLPAHMKDRAGDLPDRDRPPYLPVGVGTGNGLC